MDWQQQFARFENATLKSLAGVVPRVLQLAQQNDDVVRLWSQALPTLATAANVAFITVTRAEHGQWKKLASFGPSKPLPEQLLGETLDGDEALQAGHWGTAPLEYRSANSEVLALWMEEPTDELSELADALAGLLGAATGSLRLRQQTSLRVKRLEAILEIAAQWNQTHEMVSLLEHMAETSTRLIDAERASIFLWDRRNKLLVGRPALGVPGGELRIPDDRGVVGRIVQTGQPQRVDAEVNQNEIDRHVDQQLGFHTRTLLCVPLRGRKGELFGAFELINKKAGNFTAEDEAALVELAQHAAIALENTQEIEQLLKSRQKLTDQAAQSVEMIGESPAINALRSTIKRVADTELAVLILGENGVGKDVVARMIHYLSRRRNEPLVAVNCAALPDTLLESELFGHEKGAFTDARETRQGKFEIADGGTLFLDEIGDLSLAGQSKLLRVLEEKIVVHVGGSTPIQTDVRVIAATNQDLGKLVRERKFREDLYFRINVVTLEPPPLRDRGDDVLLLGEHFLRDFSLKARRKVPKITAAARKKLREHPWPGNVRELRNLMERLAYLTSGDKLDVEDLAFVFSPNDSSGSRMSLDLTLADATQEFQIDFINRQLKSAGGSVVDAARKLGLHRSNLYRKMRQLGMTEDGEDSAAERDEDDEENEPQMDADERG